MAHLTKFIPQTATSFRISENSFVVVASQVTEMLESNSIAPYKFIKVSGVSCDSVHVAAFIQWLCTLAFCVYLPIVYHGFI